MADCRTRKVDAVVVWKIDRFGRSLKHLVNDRLSNVLVGPLATPVSHSSHPIEPLVLRGRDPCC